MLKQCFLKKNKNDIWVLSDDRRNCMAMLLIVKCKIPPDEFPDIVTSFNGFFISSLSDSTSVVTNMELASHIGFNNYEDGQKFIENFLNPRLVAFALIK